MPSTRPLAGGISLRHLFPQATFVHAADIQVHAVCDQVERVRPGDLFVAREDESFDGHWDADQALKRGAVAVLSERLLPVSLPQCVVPDSNAAFGRVCQSLAGDPSRQMATIGVSGSNGKTITSLLIAAVLKAGGVRTGYTTTLQNTDSLNPESPVAESPAPPELADWMARMTAAGCEAAVLECGSRSLARRELTGVEFDAAVLTDLRREHLNGSPSFRCDRRIKLRMFEHLAPDGMVVINADDPHSQRLLPSIKHPVLTVGHRVQADITAKLLDRCASEQTILLSAGSDSVPVRTAIIGDVHISHCLQAAAIGLIAGLDLPTIARGLERVRSLPGRLERIECGQSFSVFVDEAQTPDRLAVALHTLRSVTQGRIFCVYGVDANCPESIRPLLGRVAERAANVSIITSNNPRFEKPRQIAHDILDGCEHPERPHVIPSRDRAIQWALEEARPGDCVLIAGKGDRVGEVIGKRRQPFDDREVAKQTLYELAADEPVILPFPGVRSRAATRA
ncbi:MAG: UDP-N-acetylmuramyl-tripeptide synthetase [Planctomycetales bacterium]|nr:UDP-N-acetylmuramyl-tripeptide synthetase [Planctomycetales bacterium]